MLRLLVLIGATAAGLTTAMPTVALEIKNTGTDEHAVVANGGVERLALGGWILASQVGDQKYRFPDVLLGPGSSLRVVSGTTVGGANDLAWTRRNVWNNEGDAAFLFDAAGQLIAEVRYGRAPRPASTAKASSQKGTRAKR